VSALEEWDAVVAPPRLLIGVPIDVRTVLALVPVSWDDIGPMDTKRGDGWGSSIRDSSRLQY